MSEITYARLFNLGNYENERVELSSLVMPGESYADAFDRLRRAAEEIGRELVERRRAERERARAAESSDIPF